jgi:hypothetical protein
LRRPLRLGDEGGSIESYLEFLANNERALAFDELELLGQANHVSGRYWQELAAAAALMILKTQADRCPSRMNSSARGPLNPPLHRIVHCTARAERDISLTE